jgi:T5orf172 domain
VTARHPPLIAVYDDGRGEYVLAEEGGLCAARWSAAALAPDGDVEHGRDEICGRDATCQLGDVDLCDHHFDRALRDRRQHEDGERRERVLLLVELERDREQWPEAKLAARERALDERQRELSRWSEQLYDMKLRLAAEFSRRNVIYYLRRASDGLIKIGTTRDLPTRMTNLRREHGEARLLLTHDGGYDREDEMHEQFAALRVVGEWFRPEPALLEWIVGQREREDIPVAPTTVPIGYILELAAAVLV